MRKTANNEIIENKSLDVSVITISHNHAAYLQVCLASLVDACHGLGSEVIVIDNCSDDNTVELVERDFPYVRLIRNSSRHGFAYNANLGMHEARGRYVLLLNPDTEAVGRSVGEMVIFMDQRPDVGLVGAQLLFPDGAVQPSCRRFPTWRSVLARRTPLRRLLRHSRWNVEHLMGDSGHDRVQEVDWLLGACLMVRREAIADVGLLDEKYYLYVEDIDWCLRMHQHGWKVLYLPATRFVHHHLAVTDKQFFTKATLHHFRGMLRFWRKHKAPNIPLLRIHDWE